MSDTFQPGMCEKHETEFFAQAKSAGACPVCDALAAMTAERDALKAKKVWDDAIWKECRQRDRAEIRMVREALELAGPVKAEEQCLCPGQEGEALAEAVASLTQERDTLRRDNEALRLKAQAVIDALDLDCTPDDMGPDMTVALDELESALKGGA